MPNSKIMTESINQALEELSALSREELLEILDKRELGDVGYLMLETGTIEHMLKELENESK